MTTTTTTQLGDISETYLSTGKRDSKGRMIGFIVGFRDDGTEFFAWVQNARLINGMWADYGVRQRSRSFPAQHFATTWAYAAVRVRIAKIQKGA